MKSIGQIMEDSIMSPWRGSPETEEHVREQVRERFGDAAADSFSAAKDAMPLLSWSAFGYRVKRGARALKSITYVEVKGEDGKVEKKIRKVVNLFHRNDVEKVA
jgi:hypothetical protein